MLVSLVIVVVVGDDDAAYIHGDSGSIRKAKHKGKTRSKRRLHLLSIRSVKRLMLYIHEDNQSYMRGDS